MTSHAGRIARAWYPVAWKLAEVMSCGNRISIEYPVALFSHLTAVYYFALRIKIAIIRIISWCGTTLFWAQWFWKYFETVPEHVRNGNLERKAEWLSFSALLCRPGINNLCRCSTIAGNGAARLNSVGQDAVFVLLAGLGWLLLNSSIRIIHIHFDEYLFSRQGITRPERCPNRRH